MPFIFACLNEDVLMLIVLLNELYMPVVAVKFHQHLPDWEKIKVLNFMAKVVLVGLIAIFINLGNLNVG